MRLYLAATLALFLSTSLASAQASLFNGELTVEIVDPTPTCTGPISSTNIEIFRGSDGFRFVSEVILERHTCPDGTDAPDWNWRFGSPNNLPGFNCVYGVYPCDDTSYIVVANDYPYAFGLFPTSFPGDGSFFFPDRGSGAGVDLEVSVDMTSATDRVDVGGSRGNAFDGFRSKLGEDWILPYDAGAYASAGGTGQLNQFIASLPQGLCDGLKECTDPRTYTFADTGNDVLVPAAFGAQNWDTPDLDLRFHPGQQLRVEPDFAADGTAFGAADPVPGWHGIWFGAGATGTLTDATVSGVAFPAPGPREIPFDRAAVEAYGADVTLSGTTVSGTVRGHGVLALGAGALVTLGEETEFLENEHYGAKAATGGTVILDGALLEENDLGGLYAADGTVNALRGNVIDNLGPGVSSRGSGTAELARTYLGGGVGNKTGGTFVTVNGNRGGLSATHGASVTSLFPLCPQGPCTFSRHDLADNALNPGDFDARSKGGSSVLSEGNFWGPGITTQLDLTIHQDLQSVVSIQPDDTPVSLTGSTGTSAKGGSAGFGGGTDGVFALIADAEAALAHGDTDAAHAALLSALVSAFTEDEQAAAYAAAARVLRQSDSGAILAWLVSHTEGPTRDGALGAIAAAHEGAGRYADAAEAYEALAEADAAAFSGLARVAVLRQDEVGALRALGGLLRAGDGEAIGETATLVLAAFPDANFASLQTPSPERTASKGSTGAERLGLSAPQPNPTAGASLVRFALGEAGPARLVVYDALGREVAVLADGEHAEGTHLANLDGRALAPGVYLVRLTTDDGMAETTRLTVIR